MTSGPPQRIEIPHGGRQRAYWLRVPGSGGSAPLVVELHGRGIDPLAFDRWTGFDAVAVEQGFALAMPAAMDGIWNDGRFANRRIADIDDVGFIDAVIDDVGQRMAVDPDRVHVVGMSNGATMTARQACQGRHVLAAIAQVAGTVGVEVVASCRPTRPTAVLLIHGTGDRFAPYEGGTARGVGALLLGRRRAGPTLGVDRWAGRWIGWNGAAPTPEAAVLGPDTTVRHWIGPDPAAEIACYRVEGGGHTWPGTRGWTPGFLGRTSRTFDATAVIWEFFSRHRAAGPR